MPASRLLAVGLWLAVTAAATAIVWAGTSTVAADLTDRPAPVIAHQDVVNALQSDAPAPETTPGISPPAPDATGAPSAADPTGDDAAVPTPGATPPGVSGSETPPAIAGVPAPVPAAPPTTVVSPPTTQAPQGPTATYSLAGGTVTVACTNGFFIGLVSATPNNGYAVNVVAAGPYYVEVHFVRAGRDDPLWAYCLGRPVRAYGGAQIPGQPG